MRTCLQCGCSRNDSEFEDSSRKKCKFCRSNDKRDWRRKHPDRAKAATLKGGGVLRRKDKERAFDAYGGRFCSCCGETEMLFLTIDHVNGDGGKHRKELNGKKIYAWLRQNNYPEGYQVLCFNCKHR
jgi:hypothetical protein